VFVRDITERKQAEEHVAYHAHLLENVHDAIVATDERLVVTAWNRAAEEIYGWKADEVIGRDVREVVRSELDAGRRDEVLRILAETGHCRVETTHHRKDGTPIDIEGTVIALRNAAGRVTRYLTAHRDITERKRAEGELSKQIEVLQTIIDSIPLMIRFLGSDARVQLVNRMWERTLGWSLEEVKLRGFDLFNELYPDPQERQRALEFVAAASGEWADFRLRTRDGPVIDVAFADIRLSDGTSISIGQDITERKQAEEALRRAHEELEQRVIDRTSQLTAVNEELRKVIIEREQTEETLREAQAELAHVTRVTMMGELTASIAHEINQPLGAIVTNAQTCLRLLARVTPELEKSREVIGRIIDDGMRASEVIKRIRALLKRAAPEKELLSINETIRGALSLVESELVKNQVVVRKELDTTLSPVLGDRIQLQQVVLNLILNGIEAMSGEGWQPRELLISSQQSKRDEVTVAVRDSGHGLDPQDVERIFDAFVTSKEGGLGLGLSISRTIIESQGGRLWAISNEGQGTTFQFKLPTG
jgi:PAS domain S-box-containing protein